MADSALHDIPSVYEPSLFGTYSKKIGMWLFLLSDSLTFGALLYAYSYGRISTPDWPTPFHSESIINATIMTAFLLTSSLTMVLAVRASVNGDSKAQRLWLLATMFCGTGKQKRRHVGGVDDAFRVEWRRPVGNGNAAVAICIEQR